MVDDAIDQWQKDWKSLLTQKDVTLNSYCDVAGLWNWRSYYTEEQLAGFKVIHFFGGRGQYNFDQINKFNISQVSVATFLTYGGPFHDHLVDFLAFYVPNTTEITVFRWEVLQKWNGEFFWITVYYHNFRWSMLYMCL